MLRHIVLFRWTAETTEADVAAISDGLAGLPAAIEEIRSYRFGPDLGLIEGSFDFGLVAEFDDESAWRTYRDHPAHQVVIAQLIAPHIAERASVQQIIGT